MIPKEFQHCDPPQCTPDLTPLELTYPKTIKLGEKTVETTKFIQNVLREAWGEDPPVVDLYLRTGCNGLGELKYLLESVRLFWPLFLGDVLIVLDQNDQPIIELLKTYADIPFSIVYEHCPYLPGRVFNQVSYLKLFKYTSADYVVTIDSDCVFHAPVTPDYLFSDKKLYFVTSTSFQVTDDHPIEWERFQVQVTGLPSKTGHAMVTQPISLRVDIFPKYLEWIHQQRGLCYEQVVSEKWFCERILLDVSVECIHSIHH